MTLPALEIAPPSIFWPKEEIAIDAFHHAVYALATGLAYELLERAQRRCIASTAIDRSARRHDGAHLPPTPDSSASSASRWPMTRCGSGCTAVR